MNEAVALERPSCRECGQGVSPPNDVGWECECGVIVCKEPSCFEELFKTVADGEGVRCRSCGLVG